MIAYSPILYAEDDANDVFFLQHAFEEAGISNPLQVAPDGQAAIDYLSGAGQFADRARYPLPCLILLDLKMPRRTGMEVLKWLRQESAVPYLPTIIFSSSAHLADVERTYRLGANAFITKPADLNERTRLARAIKEFWLHFTEAPMGCLSEMALR